MATEAPDVGPRFQRLRTTDLDLARTQMVERFVEHEMSIPAGKRLDLRLDLTSSSRLTLAKVGYGADVRIVAPPMEHCYQVNLPLSGSNTVRQNGTTLTSEAGRNGVALQPDTPIAMRWQPDAVQFAMKFSRSVLEDHAARLAARPLDGCLRFVLRFDLDSAAGQALLATARFLWAELGRRDGLIATPTARREMESALMTQLLTAVPSQVGPTLQAEPAPTRRSRILEVMEYIDEHPADDLGTADLARLAGVGARALQAGFRDVAGLSPRAYVRGVRLDRVRLELSAGTAGGVSEVAARWGFFHPGRFARQYRDRFGERPSDTTPG